MGSLERHLDHVAMVRYTQHGIIRYAEAMAQVLAEAGRASHDAVGDSPEVAVRRWSNIITQRALEILKESPADTYKRRRVVGNPCLTGGVTIAGVGP